MKRTLFVAAFGIVTMSTITITGCAKSENSQSTDTTAYSQTTTVPTTPETTAAMQPQAAQPETSASAQPAMPNVPPAESMTKHGDTVTTPSGLKYIDLKKGKGPMPKKGQTITVNYTGKLTDGKTFDSNVDPNFHHVQPFQTAIGVRTGYSRMG